MGENSTGTSHEERFNVIAVLMTAQKVSSGVAQDRNKEGDDYYDEVRVGAVVRWLVRDLMDDCLCYRLGVCKRERGGSLSWVSQVRASSVELKR